jgi:hypothetical protein
MADGDCPNALPNAAQKYCGEAKPASFAICPIGRSVELISLFASDSLCRLISFWTEECSTFLNAVSTRVCDLPRCL